MKPPTQRESEEVEILLVDGDANHVEATARTFKKHGLAGRLFAVPDGQTALDFIFGEGRFSNRESDPPPKVVLLDLKAPRVESLRILKEVKADSRLKDVCVIIMAAAPHDKDLKQAYDLGADSFVAKPVKFEAFLTALSECGVYWPTLQRSKR